MSGCYPVFSHFRNTIPFVMDATTSQELQQTLIDPQKQQSAEKTAVEVVPDSAALLEDDASKSTSLQVHSRCALFTLQFSANLMKSITGSTSLIFPYTMWQVCCFVPL